MRGMTTQKKFVVLPQNEMVRSQSHQASGGTPCSSHCVVENEDDLRLMELEVNFRLQRQCDSVNGISTIQSDKFDRVTSG